MADETTLDYYDHRMDGVDIRDPLKTTEGPAHFLNISRNPDYRSGADKDKLEKVIFHAQKQFFGNAAQHFEEQALAVAGASLLESADILELDISLPPVSMVEDIEGRPNDDLDVNQSISLLITHNNKEEHSSKAQIQQINLSKSALSDMARSFSELDTIRTDLRNKHTMHERGLLEQDLRNALEKVATAKDNLRHRIMLDLAEQTQRIAKPSSREDRYELAKEYMLFRRENESFPEQIIKG